MAWHSGTVAEDALIRNSVGSQRPRDAFGRMLGIEVSERNLSGGASSPQRVGQMIEHIRSSRFREPRATPRLEAFHALASVPFRHLWISNSTVTSVLAFCVGGPHQATAIYMGRWVDYHVLAFNLTC